MDFDEPDTLIGPPSWDQSAYIGNGYPYYRPNFILVVAILWFTALCVVSTLATILLRRSKRKNSGHSIIQELLTWRKGYWSATLCMFVTSAFAITDNGIRLGMKYVQQRYFMVQLLFNSFDYLYQMMLLFTIYSLLFQLMRWSSLRSKALRSKYFGKFVMVRFVLCVALGILSIILQGMDIASLTNHVFSLDDNNTEAASLAAYSVCLTFQLLYWLATMEVLVVSGLMVTIQRRHRLGKQSVCASPRARGHN